MRNSSWSSQQEANLFASVVSSLDGPDFTQSLLAAIGFSVARLDHCSVFFFDRRMQVRHMGTASAVSLELGICSAERYAGGLHVYDPLQRLLNSASDPQSIQMYQLTPERIPERAYRESLAQLDTIERLSILRKGGGNWYSLNLYRSKASGRFSVDDLDRLRNAAPLLGSLTEKHVRLSIKACGDSVAPPQIEERLRRVSSQLSPREIAVCKMVLLGYTSEAISQNLGLRYNTILTYRKRAYAKLRISSQNELFRLCLN
jgi:DNA-binding CsgD family transcriptional regulator